MRQHLGSEGAASPAARQEGHAAPPRQATPTYRAPFTVGWWTGNRRYVLYMLREFTAVPVAIWMLWFLVEIARTHGGAAAYRPNGGPVFVVFSVVCLVLALWHSFTFLRLSGLIVRVPLGGRTLPAPAIVGGSFVLMFLATVVIASLLVLGGR